MNTEKNPSERRRGPASPRGAAAPSAQQSPLPRGPRATAAGLRRGCALRPAPSPAAALPHTHCASPTSSGRSAPRHEPGPHASQTDTLDALRSAEPDRREGETGPAYQWVLPGPCRALPPPRPAPLPGRPARPPSGCRPPGQVPCLRSESGPSPHVPHPPRLTTMERVARQGQMPTGGVQVLVWPHGRPGEGRAARNSVWGGAQRSPAGRAAAGPSCLGRRRAPGPAPGRPPPGAARSHSAPRTGSFLTRGAS